MIDNSTVVFLNITSPTTIPKGITHINKTKISQHKSTNINNSQHESNNIKTNVYYYKSRITTHRHAAMAFCVHFLNF